MVRLALRLENRAREARHGGDEVSANELMAAYYCCEGMDLINLFFEALNKAEDTWELGQKEEKKSDKGRICPTVRHRLDGSAETGSRAWMPSLLRARRERLASTCPADLPYASEHAHF
jgi:hypothetical protein